MLYFRTYESLINIDGALNYVHLRQITPLLTSRLWSPVINHECSGIIYLHHLPLKCDVHVQHWVPDKRRRGSHM